MSTALPQSAQTRGIVLMICAIFFFSLMDVSVKALSGELGTLQIIWARYGGQMAVVLVVIGRNVPQYWQTRYRSVHLLRSLAIMLATAFFFSSLRFLDLTEATAVLNLAPVLITLGGALFLGERLGPRRVAGILVAVIGAMIVIRPGTGVFTPAALLPMMGAVCLTAYTLLTRMVGREEHPLTALLYTGLVGTVLSSVVMPFVWQTPSLGGWGLMLLISVLGAVGQLLMIRALSMAQASSLAPFTYVSLALAPIWGLTFFSSLPDLPTIAGAVLIVGAGIYVWYREHQLAKTAV